MSVASIDAKIAASRFRQKIHRGRLEGLCDLRDWMTVSAPVLQRNEHSRLHRLLEALKSGQVFPLWHDDAADGCVPLDGSEADIWKKDNHVFVVKHNWLGVLGDEHLPHEDEVVLPFPICTFEFRISERNVIVIAAQNDEQIVAVGFQEAGNGLWFSGQSGDRDSPAMRLAWKEIKATCAVLDAEVASHEVVRAPIALNKKRDVAGRIPLFDFHVVDLSRRHRVSNPNEQRGVGTHAKRRLHFRRGHWRHFVTFKTWVKWCLVGDPNLGFIDKEYAL